MGAELDQFQDGFFAESFEALALAEAALLRLTPGQADAEIVNTIFRVAHSIKGSAGMFGFTEMTSFTHALESLLHELRAGRMPVTAAVCDGLLQSVDQLRMMIAARRAQQPADLSMANVLQMRFREWVGTRASPAGKGGAASLPVWKITFRALPELLLHGAEPLRMFEELGMLGALATQADCGRVLPLADVDPAHCLIRWDLTLATQAPREAIELVFEWAHGHCELKIERLEASAPGFAATEVDSIRVAVGKIDELLDRVGAIVTTQAMLSELAVHAAGPDAARLRAGLLRLQSNVGALQQSVLHVRMQPAGSMLNRFPRLVRDLSAQLGKRVRLQISGERTELDKTMLEKMVDPLVHLVRNSVDHGIETPEVRAARGKPLEGTVQLAVFHRGDAIEFVIGDDGNGLDAERLLQTARRKGLVDAEAELTGAQIHDLIFVPGFSTAVQATQVSGRGVGMDAVRRKIREMGGSVALQNDPGRGLTTTITLPLHGPGAWRDAAEATSARNWA